jgi:hypothetical protein
VGFEPTIPVFVRGKIVHALERVVTVIGVFEPQRKELTGNQELYKYVLIAKYYWNHQIKEDATDRSCSASGIGEERRKMRARLE